MFGIRFTPKRVTVFCDGGWKYTGLLVSGTFTPYGSPYWLEIKTRTSIVKVNVNRVVSILYADEN